MSLKTVWHNLAARLISDEPESLPEPPSLQVAVERARNEWAAARAYFETVSDPQLVDHAIYMVEAAEKKFMYLISEARRAGARAAMAPRAPTDRATAS